MGAVMPLARRAWQTSRPSASGSPISRTVASNSPVMAVRSALAPSTAVVTAKPSARSPRTRTSRRLSSSSTTSTRVCTSPSSSNAASKVLAGLVHVKTPIGGDRLGFPDLLQRGGAQAVRVRALDDHHPIAGKVALHPVLPLDVGAARADRVPAAEITRVLVVGESGRVHQERAAETQVVGEQV